ncbi:hypothetical protein ABZ863_26495 [Saccharomonospora sp. NPDC046836]|uniref:hypothetical protein n=1 Tax=Saccharomonospora sp. NPDC046836 TaxID=3156921 RepID=UPI00340DBE4F
MTSTSRGVCRTLTDERTAHGIDHVILMVEGTGSRERTLDTIARLGAEVLPALRGAGGCN